MKKEFTLIYFNEDGGCNISFNTLEEINKFLNEVLEEIGNPLDKFVFNDLDRIDSANDINSNQKYMIIKGLPIQPRITKQVQKLEI